MRILRLACLFGLFILLCQPLIAQRSGDAEAFYNKGCECGQLGNWQEAATNYKKATILKPGFAEASMNLAEAYNHLGQFNDAVIASKDAINFDSNSLIAYYNLGLAYTKLENWPEAEKSFNKALQIDPNSLEANYGDGLLHMRLNRNTQAVESFKKVLSIKSDSSIGHFGLGLSYIASGEKESAMQEYGILQTLDPQLAEKLRIGIETISSANASNRSKTLLGGAIQAGRNGEWPQVFGYIVFGMLFAVPAAWFARNRNRSPLMWGLGTMLAPPLFLIIPFMPKMADVATSQSQHPNQLE